MKVYPIGRLVVTRVPRLFDAAGGAMVLLQTAAKGDPYDKGWSACVAVMDAAGRVRIAGLKGPSEFIVAAYVCMYNICVVPSTI